MAKKKTAKRKAPKKSRPKKKGKVGRPKAKKKKKKNPYVRVETKLDKVKKTTSIIYWMVMIGLAITAILFFMQIRTILDPWLEALANATPPPSNNNETVVEMINILRI
jgi:hypothetical protein